MLLTKCIRVTTTGHHDACQERKVSFVTLLSLSQWPGLQWHSMHGMQLAMVRLVSGAACITRLYTMIVAAQPRANIEEMGNHARRVGNMPSRPSMHSVDCSQPDGLELEISGPESTHLCNAIIQRHPSVKRNWAEQSVHLVSLLVVKPSRAVCTQERLQVNALLCRQTLHPLGCTGLATNPVPTPSPHAAASSEQLSHLASSPG